MENLNKEFNRKMQNIDDLNGEHDSDGSDDS